MRGDGLQPGQFYRFRESSERRGEAALQDISCRQPLLRNRVPEQTEGEVVELAYLEVEIRQPKQLTAQVARKDFVISHRELIPEEVRSKVKKWCDDIDDWAVDWDFRNDTFIQGWAAYRARRERKLPLVSGPHACEGPGRYRTLVKGIDIFGNDASQGFDVGVK